MTDSEWIENTIIAQLLRMSDSALDAWQANGRLVGKVMHRVRHYHVSVVNNFLASCQHTFLEPPKVEDLLSGRLVLLTSDEAMDHLHIHNRNTLFTRRDDGRLFSIQLSNKWRFSQDSVLACRQADLEDDRLSRKVVIHVLGISKNIVFDLTDKGWLMCQQTGNNSQYKPVIRDSLLKLLSELLPDWIDPRDWLDERLEDPRPLLRFRVALSQLGTNKAGLRELLYAQHIRYIRSPNGRLTLIPQSSIEEYLQSCKPLTSEEISRLFGVNTAAVDYWILKGFMLCPIKAHGHKEQWATLYPSCLVAILRRLLSPGMQPLHWYRMRMRYGGKLVKDYEIAPAFGVSPRKMQRLAEAGQVCGIKTPAGQWLFTPRQIARHL